MAEARVGISGWRYPPWRGVFYPRGLPQRSELAYAAEHLTSIELNGTFYSLQKPASFRGWSAETPDDFVFSVKGGRFVTHILRLADARPALANFFASGVLALEHKLGPFLWQLPPSLAFSRELLEAFFALLPRTTRAALELAREHTLTRPGGTWLEPTPDRPLRHALEVRHPSFTRAEVAPVLRDHDVALVVADTAGRWPALREVTSDFVYVRLHGQDELYVSGYTDEALDEWTAAVRGWLQGEPDGAPRDVFVYFDNDAKVRAPFDATEMLERLRTGA